MVSGVRRRAAATFPEAGAAFGGEAALA